VSGEEMWPSVQEWKSHADLFAREVNVVCCGVFDSEAGRYERAPDTGARAALRVGVRRPVEKFGLAAHRCVFDIATGHGPEKVRKAWLDPAVRMVDEPRERAYYAVAAMIAGQARDARDQSSVKGKPAEAPLSLGVALARLDEGQSHDEESPREAELRLLARQSVDGVHRCLPDVIRHLRSGDRLIPVDWAVLIVDLAGWHRRRDEVTKRWNQEYYRTRYRLRAAGDAMTSTDEQEIEAA
jgi:CRISPR system Cascade subunit CasB